MENNQDGRRPKWKTKMEDNEKQPNWKTTQIEDDPNGRQPK